ncbi:YitT family protein, partial [Mycoplasmopsis pullorum]
MTIVSFATAATFLIIYGFLSPNVYVDNQENVYTSKYIYFGMRELSTFFYILVNNLVLGIIYPKYKKVKLS